MPVTYDILDPKQLPTWTDRRTELSWTDLTELEVELGNFERKSKQ